MGKFSKKSATKGGAVPVIKATKPLKKVKRELEDDMETKTNLKKQKKNVIETIERLADRLQRIEAKVDLLATKLDLLISVKRKSVPDKKVVKAKAEISSSEDESSSSDEESVEIFVASAKPAAKVSHDSENEESDQDEKNEQKMAKSDIKIPKKESVSVDPNEKSDEKKSDGRSGFASGPFGGRGIGHLPFGGRFAGVRCGGYGLCRRC